MFRRIIALVIGCGIIAGLSACTDSEGNKSPSESGDVVNSLDVGSIEELETAFNNVYTTPMHLVLSDATGQTVIVTNSKAQGIGQNTNGDLYIYMGSDSEGKGHTVNITTNSEDETSIGYSDSVDELNTMKVVINMAKEGKLSIVSSLAQVHPIDENGDPIEDEIIESNRYVISTSSWDDMTNIFTTMSPEYGADMTEQLKQASIEAENMGEDETMFMNFVFWVEDGELVNMGQYYYYGTEPKDMKVEENLVDTYYMWELDGYSVIDDWDMPEYFTGYDWEGLADNTEDEMSELFTECETLLNERVAYLDKFYGVSGTDTSSETTDTSSEAADTSSETADTTETSDEGSSNTEG